MISASRLVRQLTDCEALVTNCLSAQDGKVVVAILQLYFLFTINNQFRTDTDKGNPTV